MPSGVGNKYGVALAQVSTGSVMGTPVGYNLRGNGYAKQDADTFAPRFGTGEVGLNSLDIWKTWQMTDFSGGGFQDKWDDTTKQLTIRGILNKVDNRLYPTPTKTTANPAGGTRSSFKSRVVFRNELYRISNGAGTAAPGYGRVDKYVPSTKTWSMVKQDFVTAVASLIVMEDKLLVSTNNGLYWTFDGTTWANQAAPAFTPTLLKNFNGVLYATDNDTSTNSGKLIKHDGTSTTGTPSVIGTPGDINENINSWEVFNHRLYMGKSDGLYAYDGVTISTILDYSNDKDPENFRIMAVYEGALYFIVRNTLMKFNGSTVEKVRQFNQYETITSLDSAYGRLWIGTYVETTSTGSGQTLADVNLYYFDGVGFFLYDVPATGVTSGFTPLVTSYLNDGTYKHLIFEIRGASGVGDNTAYVYNLASEFQTGNGYNDLTIITSEFDAGFPYIDKYNDSATLTYEGSLTGDTLTAYWRIHDGSTWGAFSSTVGGTFRRLQLKLVIDRVHASSGLSLTSFSLRYVLSPDMKRKWTLTFLCVGTTDQPEELLDGIEETLTAKKKREQIYACRINDVPSVFEDIDTCKTGAAFAAGAVSLTVDDTSTFPPSGYIKVEDELILYSAKTATSFTGLTRGRWGTADVAHNTVGTIVGTAYRVIITKIVNERIVAPNNQDGLMDTAGNVSELTAIIQEV